MLLKTTTSAPDRVGLGSHAGSHTDEQPRDAPNLCGQPGETNPRSRTNLNGDGRPAGIYGSEGRGCTGRSHGSSDMIPAGREVAHTAISGSTRVSFAAMRAWPSSPVDWPN